MAARVEDSRVEERPAPIVIALEDLDAETLGGLVEAFVNREGTDYGASERSFESKVEDVLRQLRSGEALIVFDPETETVNPCRSESDRRAVDLSSEGPG